MGQWAEGYAGRVSWLCCFNIKRFPRGVLQPPSPEVFKPQLDKALTAGSEPRAECPEQDLGLDPSWAAPSSLAAGTCTGHSNSTLCDGTTLTSIYSFDTFLLTLQGLPGVWYDICDCAWINKKPHSSAVKASQLPSFPQKPFTLILQDLTHCLIVFSIVGDCWQHSIFLQPAPQALAIHCLFTSKVCCEQLTWKPHCWNFTFFSLNAYKWVKKWSIH